ncbi:MAG TPA: PDZ domain-containing protein [Burkholderiales bacterium]|nr:PDZ domain-containing protein [Burkholderiales bacterium]
MRRLLACLALLLAACGEPVASLREVTIESPAALRLSLRELPPAALRALGLPYGLSVVKAGALARRAGLRVGDVVYAVNERRIRDVDDFTRLVAEQPAKLGFLVRRGRSDFYVPMELGGGVAPGPARARDTLLRT